MCICASLAYVVIEPAIITSTASFFLDYDSKIVSEQEVVVCWFRRKQNCRRLSQHDSIFITIMPTTYFRGVFKGTTASINPICIIYDNEWHWLITTLEMLRLVPADQS